RVLHLPVREQDQRYAVAAGGGAPEPEVADMSDDHVSAGRTVTAVDVHALVDLVWSGSHRGGDVHVVATAHKVAKMLVGGEPRPHRRVRRVQGRGRTDEHPHVPDQLDVTGSASVFVSLTNALASLTRKPYSASARIAIRLCSNSETSELLIVTEASVVIR